ncbi:EAL domain-containing protein [Porticoccaceae bacterium]|nr:EAL domain-containing protein [Porticoccaceae bacterium]
MAADIPFDEVSRLSALRELNILDTEAEQEFDELTALAAQVCQAPIALISLVDEQRQWLKSRVGLNLTETPRDIAFCAHAILQPNSLLEVPDTQLDNRFSDNPLVLEAPNIRFYAGAPLIDTDGHALGTLCVIDHVPRKLAEAQRAALTVLSRAIVQQLELRRRLQRIKNSTGKLLSHNSRLEAEIKIGAATLEDEVVMHNESELLSRQILDRALDGVINLDQHGRVTYWNAEAERIFGYSSQYAHSRDIIKLILPPHQHLVVRELMEQFMLTGVGKENHRRFEINALRANGTKVPVEISVIVLQRFGEYFFNGFVRDLTEYNKNIEELRVSAIIFNSQDAIIVTDAEIKILRVNQKVLDITGYTSEDLIGSEPSLLSSTMQSEQFYREMWRTIGASGSWEGEVWDQRKSGELFPLLIAITAIRDAKDRLTNYVFSFSDITATKRDADAIHKLAYFDPLTHLPNRRTLIDRLPDTLSACESERKTLGLLFVDLDHFKDINDALGNHVGDKILIGTAQRLRDAVASGDTVARIGGDDFVVVLKTLDSNIETAKAEANTVATHILASLNRPYEIDQQEIRCAASIGVALADQGQISIEELLKQADIGLYQAKTSGRNQICFFDPAMAQTVTRQAQLANALHSAVQDQQLELYYQIQVDDQNRPVGAEALIRWEHPQLGIISPNDFIPLAEASDTILPIGLWVLDSACAQLKSWQSDPHTCWLSIAINISPRQFHQKDFVDTVLQAIGRWDISPGSIKLELTETVILDNTNETIEKMYQLKRAGVEFALDDFGTGYSSLSYLTQLPLSQLKMDQSFVSKIGIKESDDIIVQTILAMAKSLAIKVIAEGVETEAQRSFLAKLGCPLFQGYLFGKPVPIAEFEKLLLSHLNKAK